MPARSLLLSVEGWVGNAGGGGMSRDELVRIKRDDLMKADLLSEIVLLASGVAVVVALVMVVVAAFGSAALAQ